MTVKGREVLRRGGRNDISSQQIWRYCNREKQLRRRETANAKLCRTSYSTQGPPDEEPVLGFWRGVGWLGSGWDGFVHLRPRDGAGAARVAAAIRNPRRRGEHRFLRGLAVCTLSDWLGLVAYLGTNR